jgi:hypothetical protein
MTMTGLHDSLKAGGRQDGAGRPGGPVAAGTCEPGGRAHACWSGGVVPAARPITVFDLHRCADHAGHRDGICLIGAGPGGIKAPGDSIAAVERLQGILETLDTAGVRVAEAIGASDWQPDHGFDATTRLLRRNPRPSALLCFNDRLALGAYQALADAGLEVSADVSVVSFDDDVFASWIRPQLTTVALPHYELGRAAVELLLGQVSGSAPKKQRIQRVPMPLRERSSVRDLTHPGPPTHSGPPEVTRATA